MPTNKRRRDEEDEEEPADKVRDPAERAAQAAEAARAGRADAEMYEDDAPELEEDEDIVGSDEEYEEDSDDDFDVTRPVFRPGIDKVEEGELLEAEPGTYEMLHRAQASYPCLSFDVMGDQVGPAKTKYPLTTYIAAGTQAENGKDSALMVMKWSQLHRTKFDDMDESASESESDDDQDAAMDFRMIKHEGCVNRVRCMPQAGHVVSTWSETGKVHIWDVESERMVLDPKTTPGRQPDANPKPLFTFSGHTEEGYGMGWSPHTAGQLATGGCDSNVFVWTPSEGGWSVGAALKGHSDSVEDVCWKRGGASAESTLATGSVDGTVRLWDTRTSQCATVMQVHDCDVNVVSWNPVVGELLVTGAEDGSFKCWDVRFPNEVMAHFHWHQQQITSVDWHPIDETVLAVASADDTVSIWDMSVEDDHKGELPPGAEHYPAQLLFLHMGQTEVKELHWLKAAPGVCVSTAASGFNCFKPCNLAA